MIVERIWTGNAYRNYHYLVVCPESGEALAIDPLDHEKCLAAAKDNGWEITQVLNTHEHGDHIGGNEPVIAATGAKLLAHENAAGSIPGIDVGLSAGDLVRVGTSVELLALNTPGHTMSHICMLSQTDEPALFSGDTLFNAGAGNCHSGDPEVLFGTFTKEISALPDTTKIYPGHDYRATNLEYTLSREPDNAKAKSLLDNAKDQDPNTAAIATLADEKEINTFLRLQSPSVIATLLEQFPDMQEDPDPKTVFLRLRELRNSW
ncbi:MAG: hydroxyacylglutathione hydrolase [Gammaproteobacteria bacterium]|jgi:hydroxyacylglutathione hydrolase|nr:hydroxyacylglutathione hydrolase [Gammaproteobacteria bacterium]|tara:strand:- start:3355 stop:4143 length:789 start_codon:yes stop_codon:yes gene_type:complete